MYLVVFFLSKDVRMEDVIFTSSCGTRAEGPRAFDEVAILVSPSPFLNLDHTRPFVRLRGPKPLLGGCVTYFAIIHDMLEVERGIPN